MSKSSLDFAGPFTSLSPPLSSYLLDKIADYDQGITRMTPVQASVIPLFRGNKDVIVEAVTGSGKTLAFVIPIIERLIEAAKQRGTSHPEDGPTAERKKRGEVSAVIISPTRELAQQIHKVFLHFLPLPPPPPGSDDEEEDQPEASTSTSPSPVAVPSPLPPPLLLVSSPDSTPAQDIQRFLDLGSNIVIATPGRAEEFFLGRGKNIVRVKSMEVLVMDEADRLLDLGFSQVLTKLLNHFPKQRRTGLFSATMTDGMTELVRVGLRNPVKVVVKVESKKRRRLDENGDVVDDGVLKERRTPASLQNNYLLCRADEKTFKLLQVLETERLRGNGKFIVYMGTCAAVDYFYRILKQLPTLSQYSLHSLYGKLDPKHRSQTLEAFTKIPSSSVTPSLLLCTDVAARGLDLPDIDVVIQYDPPQDPKAFSHRCGRTARAGRTGKAVVFVLQEDGIFRGEQDYIPFLAVRKCPVAPWAELSEEESNGAASIGLTSSILDSGSASSSTSSIPTTPSSLLHSIRAILLQDRGLHDLSLKGYVSFIKSYSNHEASYIFRVKDLDMGGVATSFGLLRLPKMPEMADWRKKVEKAKLRNEKEGENGADVVMEDPALGWEDEEVDWDTFAYADKPREAQRQVDLAQASHKKRSVPVSKKSTRSEAWSREAEKKLANQVKKEKRVKRKEWEKTNGDVDTRQDDAAEKDDAVNKEEEAEEWEEMKEEEKVVKKQKKGATAPIQGGFDDL